MSNIKAMFHMCHVVMGELMFLFRNAGTACEVKCLLFRFSCSFATVISKFYGYIFLSHLIVCLLLSPLHTHAHTQSLVRGNHSIDNFALLVGSFHL